jgi:prepilin-type N-terminal cleavage/methylation domain-containing protein/prepilin-type processing-associated H-X9-DG protein
MKGCKRPGGFTLVEMLVVITLITMLVAITVPALSSARESARAATCKNNLRQFWIGLAAVADRTGKYSSGSFDWMRDGCPTEVGWVADLVGIGTLPGKMLCPSNEVKVSRTYHHLLTASGGFSPLSNKAGSPASTFPDGTPKVNACRKILGMGSGGGALAPGPARRELVETQIFLAGYNTNYCASWWMVRSAVTLSPAGNLFSAGGHTPLNNLERHCTAGPLNRARLDSSGVPSSIVPFLADAAHSTADFLSDSLGDVPGGQPMAHSMTRGPVQTTTMDPPAAANPDGTPYATWWPTWNATVQDYRQFGVPHARTCQIVFADGSVRTFTDESRDGALNSGFPGGTATGFSDDRVELSPFDVFSRWRLSQE